MMPLTLDHLNSPRLYGSAIFAERIVTDQEVAALAAIAQTMSTGCKPIRVQGNIGHSLHFFQCIET